MSSTNYTRLLAQANRNRENPSSYASRLSSENDYLTTYSYRQNQPPLRQNIRHYTHESLGLQAVNPNIPYTATDRSMKESVIVRKVNPTKTKKPVEVERKSHSIRGRGVILPQREHNSFVDKENRMSFIDGGKRHSFGGVTRSSFIDAHSVTGEGSTRNSSYVSREAVTRKATVECLTRDKKQESEMVLKPVKVEVEKPVVVAKTVESKEQYESNVSEYAPVIMETLKAKDRESTPINCLKNHRIPSSLRAKMIDWMVEVLTSYKCSEQTFFIAVNTMDLFLQRTKVPQEVANLHLIGVTSMFMASKYEDIYALRLKVVCEKIAHRKLTPDQIKQMEMEILTALDYKMTNVTVYEFIMNALFQMNLKDSLSPKIYDYLHRVCLYLAKAILHDYDLTNQQDYSLLAAGIISVAFKIISKLEKNLPVSQMMVKLAQILKVHEDSISECATRTLSFTKNFEKLYPNLENLRKFNQLNYDESTLNTESNGVIKKGKN